MYMIKHQACAFSNCTHEKPSTWQLDNTAASVGPDSCLTRQPSAPGIRHNKVDIPYRIISPLQINHMWL